MVLAACLKLSEREDVPRALRAFEKLRYERVHRAQAQGPKTRERWHKADWDKVWAKPELIHLPREPWLLNFDAEGDAYQRYDEVVNGLKGQDMAKL